MKKQAAQTEPPRPRCASCGQPGTYFVSLEIKEMKLERDAGVGSRPYWSADYRNGSKLETVLCDGCQRRNRNHRQIGAESDSLYNTGSNPDAGKRTGTATKRHCIQLLRL